MEGKILRFVKEGDVRWGKGNVTGNTKEGT